MNEYTISLHASPIAARRTVDVLLAQLRPDRGAAGPVVENDPFFPEKVNVGFAQILAPDAMRLRVWERGAGLTKACGTGACAAVVAAHRAGLTARKVRVIVDGGELVIDWREDGHVIMTGPVEIERVGEMAA